MFVRHAAVGALIIAVSACTEDPTGRATAPHIDGATIAANPNNVLSVVITATARDADSVAVRFGRTNQTSAVDTTPAVPVVNQTATVPVLGLLPAADYSFRVMAFGPGGTAVTEPLEFTTGALPPDLPTFAASGSDPAPGFVTLASGKYALAIDNNGRVVWYRYFPNGAGLNLMAQQNGHYVLRPPTPEAGDIEPWVELDALGNITRTLGCAYGLQPRLHDLILKSSGDYWILCDEVRTMDLTAEGGVAAARVTGTVIQHIGPAGEVLFHWSPFDHFAITDLDAADRTGATVNWTHGNALDLDADGNLIVSFRSLGEITSIDVHTGAVRWRMGGLRNEFTFLDTPIPAFARQHGLRALRRGEIVLLDNMGNPTESRVERYLVDETTRTARLAQSYGSTPGVMTEIGGSVQPLPTGRTLVSFGTAGRVEEYDSSDRLLWHIEGNPGYVFRAQRIHSLYHPGAGDPR